MFRGLLTVSRRNRAGKMRRAESWGNALHPDARGLNAARQPAPLARGCGGGRALAVKFAGPGRECQLARPMPKQPPPPLRRPRRLVLVLGDQLNADAAVWDDFDPATDVVWMAEVAEESTQVWSHPARIAVFLSAMRHFRDALRARGIIVHYRELEEADNTHTFAGELTAAVRRAAAHRHRADTNRRGTTHSRRAWPGRPADHGP